MHKSKSVVTIFTFMHSYSYACMHTHAVKLGSYSYILAKPAYTTQVYVAIATFKIVQANMK